MFQRRKKPATSRRLWLKLTAALVLLLMLVGNWRRCLQAVGDWLVFTSDCSGEPQVAILLMGGLNSRPRATATWLTEHAKAKLLFAQPLDEEMTRMGLVPSEGVLTQKLLTLYGTPADRFTMLPPPQVINTFGELNRILDDLQEKGPLPEQIHVLTSWYHARRAAWTAERIMGPKGIKVCMVPLSYGKDTPEAWWTTDEGTLDVFCEYVKSLRYGIKYGLLGEGRRAPQ